MTLREAVRLYPRPWIDGEVTFREWMLASAIILAAIERDESARAALSSTPTPETTP